MSFLDKINYHRRILMRSFTKGVGASSQLQIKNVPNNFKVKRVLICRPNHRLGNMLLITPLVKELTNTFPECKIDLFVKGGVASVIFKNNPNIDRIISLPKKHFRKLLSYIYVWISLRFRSYDLVLNVVVGSSSGRLSTKFARGKIKSFGNISDTVKKDYPDYKHHAKYPVYCFYEVLQLKTAANYSVPPLQMHLTNAELMHGKEQLQTIVKNNNPSLCLFTNATGQKRLPKTWWKALYQNLLKTFPDYNIVEMLPIENTSQIDFEAPTFYSKDIREMCAFIANTKLFIATDSGVMHLGAASQTPTLGLFSISDINSYKPYGNNSAAINTNNKSIDDCIKIIAEMLNT